MRWRGPGLPRHTNPLQHSLDMSSSVLPLLSSGAAVTFLCLCLLCGKLPNCHSVDWDSVPVHGLCLRPIGEVPTTMPLLGGTCCLRVVGAVFSTICSVAKLPHVVARTLLISRQTCGTSFCAGSLTRVPGASCGLLDVDPVPAHYMPWLLDPYP
jgi:hypothetical protein